MRKILTACLLFLLFLFTPNAFAGQLTILTENSPPGNFIGDDGKLKGVSVEIVQEIMSRLELDILIKVLPWARSYKRLQSEADIMLFSTTRTPQRENQFKWVGPLLELQWIFITRKDTDISITSLADAKSVRRIGTYREDVREQYLKQQGFDNLHSTTDMSQLIKMLDKGRVDLVAVSNVGLAERCRQVGIPPEKFKTVFIIKRARLYMAFSMKTNDIIVQKWQNIYNDLAEEGFIQKANEKWLK